MIVYQDLKPKSKSYQKQVRTGSGIGKELPEISKGPQLSRKWVLPPKSVRRMDLEGSGAVSGAVSVSMSTDNRNGNATSDMSASTGFGMEMGGISGGGGGGVTYAEKRRKQNREAQRAYRERKASKMQELQQAIDFWKRKCESLQHESNVWKSRYESAVLESRNASQAYESRLAGYMRENSELRANVSAKVKAVAVALDGPLTATTGPEPSTGPVPGPGSGSGPTITSGINIEVQYDKNGNPAGSPPSLPKGSAMGHTPGNTCSICADGSCICDELELSGSSTSPGPTSFQDPLLQFTIDNWKPIKPVSIQAKRAGSVTPAGSTLPQFKRLKATPVGNIPVGSAVVTEDCGFCSESSTCVCREAANETACKQEPGSCSACQADSGSRKFCQNVVRWARGVSPAGQTEAEGEACEASGSVASASSSSISSASSNEYIPINDAFQRIKKHMKNSNLSPNTINYDALALKGRKVQLKSVMDIINDMNKNFI